jgi:hypothetical protein
MRQAKVLFITYDTSGYYRPVIEELRRRYTDVVTYNTVGLKAKYKNIFQKAYSSVHKILSRGIYKNYLRSQYVMDRLESAHYDIAIIIRPDLFSNSQLAELEKRSGKMVAYFHDSVNEIPRKRDVIKFFDRVFAFEKADAEKYGLEFLTNFIYREEKDLPKPEFCGFTVMSADFRYPALVRIAKFFADRGKSARFFVSGTPKSGETAPGIEIFNGRMSLDDAAEMLKKAEILVDINKFGVQQGLTFRSFEAMGFRKKLLTTNKDIKTYDFYFPENIFVIEDIQRIDIPESFFSAPYWEIPEDIYRRYTVSAWLDTLLS